MNWVLVGTFLQGRLNFYSKFMEGLEEFLDVFLSG